MDWFENEEFWRELYPYMFPLERLSAAAEQVERIIAFTGVTDGRALDLCCGPGRHAVEFARRGFQVTGVDRTAYLLERARARAADAAVEVEWVQEDMRRFIRQGAFDLACNLFTSFGYFENEEDNLRVLRHAAESLKPGGAFVLETIGKERVAHVWQNTLCTEYADGTLLLQRPKVYQDWERIHNEWTLVKDGRTRTFEFDHTLYSGRELKEAMLASGFERVRLYGDFHGNPYGLESPRLIAVAYSTGAL